MTDPSIIFAKQFGDTVKLLAQQKGSRLRNAVLNKTGVRGEECYMEQVDSITASDVTGRNQKTEITETPHARRRIALISSVVNPVLDHNDELKMIVDPTSSYVQNAVNAMGRRIDDHIIASATGTAYTGKAGGTSTSLPSTQKVVHGSAGITLAKWRSGLEILAGNDIDPDEEKFLVVKAKQLYELLAITELTSSDYNAVKALVNGQINSFLGCTVIQSERLGTDSNSDDQVLLFTKSAIGLAVSEDIVSRIDERADLNYSKQIYYRMSMGSSRLEEKKMVEIACS